MAAIRTMRRADLLVTPVKDLFGAQPWDEEMSAKIPDEELEHQAIGYYFPGGPDESQLFEVRCDPDFQFNAHAHNEHEIMFILEGELHLGRQVFPQGSAIFVPGKTLYAFKSGPQGLTFLNFRPRADATYITREELAATRKGDSSRAS